MDYYSRDQFLAQVDKKDNVVGKIEKWEAHKKGMPHRAFTVCLFYKGKIILQHRRHPVFDGYYDLTCSSHPIFVGDEIQRTTDAVLNTLEREWDIKKTDLEYEPRNKGSIYYRASDPYSKYQEYEICHLYASKVKHLPTPNFDYAYGFSLMDKSQIKKQKIPLAKSFAPWIPKLIKLL